MSPRMIQSTASLDVVREELLFTRVRLAAYPRTAKLVTPYDELLTEWLKVMAEEQQLTDARTTAAAQVAAADDTIDPLVGELSGVLLQRTDRDRTHELYRRYFKKTPSEIRRPVLGLELQTVKGWIPSLTGSADAELKRLGTALDKAAQDGDKAEAALKKAGEQIADFRMLGARSALLDKVNRTRQATHGELAQLPLTPGSTLPSDFAASFFRQRSTAAPTLATVQAAITETEQELAALRQTLKTLQDEAHAEAQAQAAQATRQAELAAAKQVLADAQARIRALNEELGA